MNKIAKKSTVFGALIAATLGAATVEAEAPARYSLAPDSARDRPALLYVSKALNHALHSYINFDGVETQSAAPQIVYVDQAYGQAIYSYPRVAPDTVTAFNVEYVNPAYSQAIFSYPRADEWPGHVELEQLQVE